MLKNSGVVRFYQSKTQMVRWMVGKSIATGNETLREKSALVTALMFVRPIMEKFHKSSLLQLKRSQESCSGF